MLELDESSSAVVGSCPVTWKPIETPLVVLAEGCFGDHESKMAMGVIRYGEWPISAVIDSRHSGKNVDDILHTGHQAPIVASLQEALAQQPKPQAMLIGTAPMGGDLPEAYRQVVKEAIQAGLHVISGLHIFLNHQPELKALAEQHGVILWDVRATTDENLITRQTPRPTRVKVITLVGTDCSVGKMSTGLELHQALKAQGEASAFVATGQTGIMITGRGVPLDRVIGDFMAGTLEREIDRVIVEQHPAWVIVEGQGSLMHPAYSGVTLSLLHGSAPDAMIMVHNPKLTTINKYPQVPLLPMPQMIGMVETAAGWIKPAKVLALALNTSKYTADEAQALIDRYAAETGLPVTDAVRHGGGVLAEALKKAF